MTPVSAYLYPWDVDGDDAAPRRLAGLGLTSVTLAAAYHCVRAVTRYHPRHRIVTRGAAAYYRVDPARWAGAALRPVVAAAGPGPGGPGSYERAAAALRAAGIAVSSWVVLTHNAALGAAAPGYTVRNAFG